MSTIGNYVKRNWGAIFVGLTAVIVPEVWMSVLVVLAGTAGFLQGLMEGC